MAPELFVPAHTQGWASPDIDERTDIWSLGVILWELSFNQLPFGDDIDRVLMARRIRQGPPPFPDHPPRSRELLDLITILLAPLPAQRPTTDMILQSPFALEALQHLHNQRQPPACHPVHGQPSRQPGAAASSGGGTPRGPSPLASPKPVVQQVVQVSPLQLEPPLLQLDKASALTQPTASTPSSAAVVRLQGGTAVLQLCGDASSCSHDTSIPAGAKPATSLVQPVVVTEGTVATVGLPGDGPASQPSPLSSPRRRSARVERIERMAVEDQDLAAPPKQLVASPPRLVASPPQLVASPPRPPTGPNADLEGLGEGLGEGRLVQSPSNRGGCTALPMVVPALPLWQPAPPPAKASPPSPAAKPVPLLLQHRDQCDKGVDTGSLFGTTNTTAQRTTRSMQANIPANTTPPIDQFHNQLQVLRSIDTQMLNADQLAQLNHGLAWLVKLAASARDSS